MYSNLLVPFDGSDSAYRAVEAAMEMGRVAGQVDITVLTVRKMSDSEVSTYDVAARLAGMAATSDGRARQDAQSEAGQSTVQSYFESLPENIDLKIDAIRGNPSDAIVDYARDHKIDCIVMGSRGLGGIRAVLGSVSTAVLRDTAVPVLIVK